MVDILSTMSGLLIETFASAVQPGGGRQPAAAAGEACGHGDGHGARDERVAGQGVQLRHRHLHAYLRRHPGSHWREVLH